MSYNDWRIFSARKSLSILGKTQDAMSVHDKNSQDIGLYGIFTLISGIVKHRKKNKLRKLKISVDNASHLIRYH